MFNKLLFGILFISTVLFGAVLSEDEPFDDNKYPRVCNYNKSFAGWIKLKTGQ